MELGSSRILAALAAAVAVLAMAPTTAQASPSRRADDPQTRCPDQFVPTKDLIASRTARQPEGASQSGSPWLPLDAVLLPTSSQRRGFMLRSIRQELASRHSSLDLREVDRVLGAMWGVQREKFVPAAQKPVAYLPTPLDIGFCQTISDGFIVALMTSAVRVEPHDNVLDVGTGSGYQAAILSRLATHVQSVEIVPQLAAQARKRLSRLGYRNVDVAAADGYAGWPARAPFDVIVVAAGATEIPQPLLNQLRPGGRLIMPVGPTTLEEQLVLATKTRTGSVTRCTLGLESFVPMTGEARNTNWGQTPLSQASRALARLPECFARPVT